VSTLSVRPLPTSPDRTLRRGRGAVLPIPVADANGRGRRLRLRLPLRLEHVIDKYCYKQHTFATMFDMEVR
jgi:hypothetical protein